MTTLLVFDPAMCCSTGICGPSVDPALARFAADLEWVKGQGVSVERFNLAQQPAAFAGDDQVKLALEEKGEDALPLIKVNGEVMSVGAYPSREALAAMVGVAPPPVSLFTEAIEELVAISAAVAASCEVSFKFHYDKARKLGVSKDDMLRAVQIAQGIKEAPSKAMLSLTDRILRQKSALKVLAEDGGETGRC